MVFVKYLFYRYRLEVPLPSPGQAFKLGDRFQEGQFDHARWAVTLLGDDDLGHAGFLAGVLGVVLVAVDEHDDVGILLDSAGFTQVTHHRALVGAGFHAAVELGQPLSDYFGLKPRYEKPPAEVPTLEPEVEDTIDRFFEDVGRLFTVDGTAKDFASILGTPRSYEPKSGS